MFWHVFAASHSIFNIRSPFTHWLGLWMKLINSSCWRDTQRSWTGFIPWAITCVYTLPSASSLSTPTGSWRRRLVPRNGPTPTLSFCTGWLLKLPRRGCWRIFCCCSAAYVSWHDWMDGVCSCGRNFSIHMSRPALLLSGNKQPRNARKHWVWRWMERLHVWMCMLDRQDE